MAEKAGFLQAIDDAILDADSLERFINGDDTQTVLTRLNTQYPTLQKAIKEMFGRGGVPATAVNTVSEMQEADAVDGQYFVVLDELKKSNNGYYQKTSTGFKKLSFSLQSGKNNMYYSNDSITITKYDNYFVHNTGVAEHSNSELAIDLTGMRTLNIRLGLDNYSGATGSMPILVKFTSDAEADVYKHGVATNNSQKELKREALEFIWGLTRGDLVKSIDVTRFSGAVIIVQPRAINNCLNKKLITNVNATGYLQDVHNIVDNKSTIPSSSSTSLGVNVGSNNYISDISHYNTISLKVSDITTPRAAGSMPVEIYLFNNPTGFFSAATKDNYNHVKKVVTSVGIADLGGGTSWEFELDVDKYSGVVLVIGGSQGHILSGQEVRLNLTAFNSNPASTLNNKPNEVKRVYAESLIEYTTDELFDVDLKARRVIKNLPLTDIKNATILVQSNIPANLKVEVYDNGTFGTSSRLRVWDGEKFVFDKPEGRFVTIPASTPTELFDVTTAIYRPFTQSLDIRVTPLADLASESERVDTLQSLRTIKIKAIGVQ